MLKNTVKLISITLILVLLWQQVVWAYPYGFSSLRALALSERKDDGAESSNSVPELTREAKRKIVLIGAVVYMILLAVSSLAVFFGLEHFGPLIREYWAHYTTELEKVHFFTFFLGLSLAGHFIASFIDRVKHWSRYLVAVGTGALFAGLVPHYVGWIREAIPDVGVLFRWIRLGADLLVATPLIIFGFCLMALRERLVDTYDGQDKVITNKPHRMRLFIKEVLTKQWWGRTRSHVTEKLWELVDVFLGVIILFWAGIQHFNYYDFSDTAHVIGIAATINPFFIIIGAIFIVKRPGMELTKIPWLNWILPRSYFIPLAAIVGIVVVAAVSGYLAVALKVAPALFTVAVAFGIYWFVRRSLHSLFLRFDDKLYKMEKFDFEAEKAKSLERAKMLFLLTMANLLGVFQGVYWFPTQSSDFKPLFGVLSVVLGVLSAVYYWRYVRLKKIVETVQGDGAMTSLRTMAGAGQKRVAENLALIASAI